MKKFLAATAVALVILGSAIAQESTPGAKPEPVPSSDPTAKSGDDTHAKHEMPAGVLKTKLDRGEPVIVIDARGSVGKEMLKCAIHVPSGKIGDWAKDKDTSMVVVTYCTCAHDEAAASAVKKLRKLGFTNAFVLAGGMAAAKRAGIPSAPPPSKEPSTD